MTNLLKPAGTFILGLIVGLFAMRAMDHFRFSGYQTSDREIKKIDAYQWNEQTKQALSFYFTALPKIIQEDIQKRAPDFDFLTSCQGDVMPGGSLEYAVSYVSGKKAQFFIYALAGDQLQVTDISGDIDFSLSGDSDYPELQCRHAAFPFSNGDFKLVPSQKALASSFLHSNREILRIRSRHSGHYGFFAYDREEAKYHLIGTLPVTSQN